MTHGVVTVVGVPCTPTAASPAPAKKNGSIAAAPPVSAAGLTQSTWSLALARWPDNALTP